MTTLLNVSDYERAARERLEPATYDYIAGGAWDEVTLAANRAAYDRWRFRPRVMIDVERRDLTVQVLGDTLSFPVGVAPSAFHQLMHADGELATARAAGGASTVMCLSIMATTALEEVARAATGPLWLQMYIFRDRDMTLELAERAASAGYHALVLTVDAPVLGRRERDPRNRFELPAGITMRNIALPAPTPGVYESPMVRFVSQQIDPSLTWRDVAWFVQSVRLPVLVKGVLRADDARRGIDAGVKGIIVSNHGGRQLDGAIATLDALPEIAAAVDPSIEVIVDGGVRRGTDVVKALALGAKMVLVGRPVLWGLAVDGETGARAVLELLRQEFDTAVALVGCPTAAQLSRDLVTRE